MILIIAEKAIAGRRIAAILAGKQLPGERFDRRMPKPDRLFMSR